MGLSELNVGQFHFRILGGAGLTGTRLAQGWGWNTGSSNAGENMKTWSWNDLTERQKYFRRMAW